MHPSVRSQFAAFATKFEGRVEYMYLDILQLVTVGIGNLIDPIDHALPLPFVYKNNPGVQASQAEIADEWNRVKAGGAALAQLGHLGAKPLTQLQLNPADIDHLVEAKLLQNEATLKSVTPEFAGFEQWPADAQLGLLSMAWAMGAAFAQPPKWPNFRQAVASQDWDTAATQSHMNDTNNPGLRPRNFSNKVLFTNAARVIEQGLPIDQLQYPTVLTPGLEPPLQMSEGWPVLREGSLRPIVTTLQMLLNAQGVPVNVTGLFDAATTAAVKAFQASQGLGVDGIVGKDSWSALVVVCRLNDSGVAVEAIQDRLWFWDVGLVFPTPGFFDQNTDDAVRAFQAYAGIGVDGVVGEETWKKLLAQ